MSEPVTTLRLEALDTLFFKDAKPFSMGEESWAHGFFPPLPTAVYGALRSAHFAGDIGSFRKLRKDKALNTAADLTMHLRIRSFHLAAKDPKTKRYAPLFPAPRDCYFTPKNGDSKKTPPGLLQLQGAGVSNGRTKSVFMLPEKQWGNKVDTPGESGLISSEAFLDYLNGKQPTSYTKLTEYAPEEPKVGIGRSDQTRTAYEGKLYRVGMFRPLLQMLISYSGLDGLSDAPFLKLGGEGKAVSVSEHRAVSVPFTLESEKGEVDAAKGRKDGFKLYLATPAIFDKGWLPSWIDPDNLTGKLPGTQVEVRLVAATLGKPLYVSGWDMALRRPKPQQAAVPAGSVYCFKVISGDVSELENLHGTCLSDDDEHSKQGFGLSYFARLGAGQNLTSEPKNI